MRERSFTDIYEIYLVE